MPSEKRENKSFDEKLRTIRRDCRRALGESRSLSVRGAARGAWRQVQTSDEQHHAAIPGQEPLRW